MSENNSKNQGKNLSFLKNQVQNLKKILNFHIQKEIFIIPIILIFIIILAGIFGITHNCCKNSNSDKDLKEQFGSIQKEITAIKTEIKILRESFKGSEQPIIEPKRSDQCMDPGKVDFNFNAKEGDFSFNSSLQGQQNLNIRSDCFWFIVFYIITLLLILLFYLIAFSSRESKLLQFIMDEKEQKLRESEITERNSKNQREEPSNG